MAVGKIGKGAWKAYGNTEFGGRHGVIQRESDGHTIGDLDNVAEADMVLRRAALQEARGVPDSIVLNEAMEAVSGYTEERARQELDPQ